MYHLAIYTVQLYINCTAEEVMNHTCCAVAAQRQTQPDAGSLLCPTPLAPLRPCLGSASPSSSCWGYSTLQDRDAPRARMLSQLSTEPRVCTQWVAAVVRH